MLIGSHQERHVSVLAIAKLVEVPPSGKAVLLGGAVTRTDAPNSENVSVATVVTGPRGKPSRTGGTFTPRGKRSLK